MLPFLCIHLLEGRIKTKSESACVTVWGLGTEQRAVMSWLSIMNVYTQGCSGKKKRGG